MEEVVSKASVLKGMLQGGHSSTQASQHSGLTIGTGLPIGAPVKTVGDVLALIQKYVGGGGGGGGQQGPSGPQGLPGPQGETGSMGPAGPAGPIGPGGISAYEVALINGFEGTEEEWLASLVGEQGLQGIQGIQGEVGPVGPAGPAGPEGPAGPAVIPEVDLSIYIAGLPAADETIFRSVITRELTLAADMAGSAGHVGVNPTVVAATFLVKRNGSTVGQVVFNLSGDAIFTTIGPGDPQVFEVGDLFELTAPATQNATMADISITFTFTREV